ncbi:MAG: RES family NAD+ phosphorylase [Rhodospirillaceae bacterium]
MSLATVALSWRPCWRIIPSRFPPIGLFERVADPADLDAIYVLESLTNPRLRDEVGVISLVPPEDRISGPHTSFIMAAFTHVNPEGSRFSDGSYGVYYAAQDLETAIAETKHHRAKFMRATAQAPQDIDMRVCCADLNATFHDLRGQQAEHGPVYDPEDYAPGQLLAKSLRKAGSDGLVYDSVRNRGGECVAVFRPRLLSNGRQERYLSYHWDGAEIAYVYEKRDARF